MDQLLERSLFELFQMLYTLSTTGRWDAFVETYGENFMVRQIRMKNHGDTPLHLAIFNGAPGHIVEKLVNIAEESQIMEEGPLEMVDYQGNTLLHLAASVGSLKSCVSIANARPLLLDRRNREGETPLFLAAARGSIEIFFCLRHIGYESHEVDKGISCVRNRSGETILHCAIQRKSWGERLFYVV